MSRIRSHWIFRLPSLITAWLKQQEDQRHNIDEMTRQHVELVRLVRDLRQRLVHHEQGPLRASRAEWDRRLESGMILPVSAKRNGRRADMKHIDATGNVRDAPNEQPPPAEAAGAGDDEAIE